MKLRIYKTHKLSGSINLPSSKSQSVRALLLAALAQGRSTLLNVLESDDTEITKQTIKLLGANLSDKKEKIEIESSGAPLQIKTTKINTGNSGITTCFVLPMLGLRKNNVQTIILDCGEQMRKRPIISLVQALNNLGMEIKSLNNNDYFPLLVSGKLIGGKTEVDGLTSQFISALLLSLPCVEKDSLVIVKNLRERPYMEMTLAWLISQEIKFKHYQKNNEDIFEIKGRQNYHPFTKQIPADFSSASYPIAAAVLISSKIKLSGINMDDAQGDKRLIAILQEMGADIKINNSELIISGGKKLTGIKIDANDIPDILPTLAVIGTQTKGGSIITNVEHARFKETDRIHSMAVELKKMGANIRETNNGLEVSQSKLNGAEVRGHSDHRTIMALSIAGLIAQGKTEIDTAENINKTFPQFVSLMNALGANIEIIKE